MGNPDFGQENGSYDLLTGEVILQRGFNYGEDGKLWSVVITFDGPWKDGVNTADCPHPSMHRRPPRWDWPTSKWVSAQPDEPVPYEPCSCGFYAYFQETKRSPLPPKRWPAETTFDHGNVLGLIKAWDRMVVGTYGVRVAKARIAAVVMQSHSAWWMRYVLMIGLPWQAVLTFTSFWWWLEVIASLVLGAGYAAVSYFTGNLKSWPKRHINWIKKNYPDVAIFNTKRAMFHAFNVAKMADLTEEVPRLER